MLDKIKNIYFLGIGGIGMSAIARYFNAKGYSVAGYDKTETELADKLRSEGIQVHFEDNTVFIPEDFKNPNYTLVVYTPAIPDDLTEYLFFKKNNFTIMKRSQILGAITKSQEAICIAGTHGKTTTTTMIAHTLHNSFFDCNAFLGGLSKNFESNLHLSNKSNLVVVEADEFDRSFLTLAPQIAVVTATDADHLDIYGTYEEYLKSFEQFVALIKPGGALIMKNGLPIKPVVQEGVKIYTYSVEKGDFHAENIKIANGKIIFDVVYPLGVLKGVDLGVPVYINIENAIATCAVSLLKGLSHEEIRKAIASFQGVARRFDFHIKQDNLVLVDDYAHHPNEVKASIESLRRLYSDKKLTGVFQPHLYTRTRDFADEFAASLSLLDEVLLLDIYPAREEPIEGVTSQIILDKVTAKEKRLISKDELLDYVRTHPIEVLATIGAGDVNLMLPQIKNILLSKV